MIKVYVNEDYLVTHDKKNEKGYVEIDNWITNLCSFSNKLGTGGGNVHACAPSNDSLTSQPAHYLIYMP